MLGLVARFYVPCAEHANGNSQIRRHEPSWGAKAPLCYVNVGTSPFRGARAPCYYKVFGEQELPLLCIMQNYTGRILALWCGLCALGFRGSKSPPPIIRYWGARAPLASASCKIIQVESWPCGAVYAPPAKREDGKSHIREYVFIFVYVCLIFVLFLPPTHSIIGSRITMAIRESKC